MRFVTILFFLQVYRFVTCGDVGTGSSGLHILDILNPNETLVAVTREDSNGIKTITLVARSENKKVSILSDGGLRIWIAGTREWLQQCKFCSKNGHLSILFLSFKRGDKLENQYMFKENNAWKVMDKEDYDYRLQKMNELEEESTDINPTVKLMVNSNTSQELVPLMEDDHRSKGVLDISNPNKRLVSFGQLTKTSGISSSYKKLKDDVIKVMDGDVLIWTFTEPYPKFLSCFMHKRDGYSSILSISLENGSLYYRKVDKKWTEIESRKYLDILYKAQNSIPEDTVLGQNVEADDNEDTLAEVPSGEVTIDFLKPVDDEKVKMMEHKVQGVDERRYETKGNVHIKSVKDDGKDVWKADKGEYVTIVTLILQVKFPLLVVIRFKKDGNDTFFKTAYLNNKWEVITDKTFYTQLRNMRENAHKECEVQAEAITAALQKEIEPNIQHNALENSLNDVNAVNYNNGKSTEKTLDPQMTHSEM